MLELLALIFLFTDFKWALSFYCAGWALFYGAYLILDVHMVQETNNLDDYITSAIIVYIDIVRVFIYLVGLFGSRKAASSPKH